MDGTFIIGDSSNTKAIKENVTKNELKENCDVEIAELKKENEYLKDKICKIHNFLDDELYKVIKK